MSGARRGSRGFAGGKWMECLAIASALAAAGCDGASEPVLELVVEPFDAGSCGRSRCDAGPGEYVRRRDANPPMDADRDASWDYLDAGAPYDVGAYDAHPEAGAGDFDGGLWK